MKSIKRFLCLTLVFLMLASFVPIFHTPSDAAAMKIYGIDVSKWQGTIDWAKVKAAGVKFAIIRIGTTQGKDGKFEQNYTAAKAQGIDVGVYFYTYSKTQAANAADAQTVVNWLAGRKLEYPVYFDLEDSSLLSGYTNADRTNFCIAFNTVIENAGYYAGVYTGYYWLNNYVNASTLRARYPIWMARYLNSGTDSQDYSSICGMWQYSSKGSVNGISGNVDMNVCYNDYPTYIKSHGLSGYSASPAEPPKAGFYSVTATALNIRAGDSSSYESYGTVPNGTELAVVGFNAANTWANIRYNGINGWCSMTYLSFKKAFPEVTVRYDSGEVSATVPSGAAPAVFTNYTVSSAVPAYAGYEFTSWKLTRSSDGKWQKTDGTWTSDSAAADLKTYAPSSQFAINEYALNSAAATETYTFVAGWDYVAPIQMAYYTVTTNTSPLMVRAADNTSATILARAPKGSEVAVIGFNADLSWARVIYQDVVGWSSMTYLTFKESFGSMTFSYDMNGVPGVFCPSAVYSPFETATVGGDGIEASGYEFRYWTLRRSSDNAIYCTDGTWDVNATEDRFAHIAPNDELYLGYSNLNRAVSNDTYVFTAVWEVKTVVKIGDVNGDGSVNLMDLKAMKMYVAGMNNQISFQNSDMNGDGVVTIKDVAPLKSLIAGN